MWWLQYIWLNCPKCPSAIFFKFNCCFLCLNSTYREDQFPYFFLSLSFLVVSKWQDDVMSIRFISKHDTHTLLYSRVLKRALHLLKRAPHLLKRALHLLKRALHLLKTALHLQKSALCFLQKAPYFLKRALHPLRRALNKRALNKRAYHASTCTESELATQQSHLQLHPPQKSPTLLQKSPVSPQKSLPRLDALRLSLQHSGFVVSGCHCSVNLCL